MPREPKWKIYARRVKQLDEQFNKMHMEQAEKYGMFWVGMNEKLAMTVQSEFPEVGFVITGSFPNVPYRKELYRTMLTRIAQLICEEMVKASERNKPVESPAGKITPEDLDFALKFWNDVQKGCKKCGASVIGNMTFPKEGGGPLCKVCAEAAREAREK